MDSKAETFEGFLLKEANPKLLRHLAEHRKTPGTATTVDFLHKKFIEHGIRRSEVIDVLKACAYEGAGKFYTGRHGQKSRIVWSTDRTEFAKNILRQRGEPSNENYAPQAPESARTEEEDTGIPMVRHPYILRADLELGLELPRDLTTHEANRLAEFIKTLGLG